MGIVEDLIRKAEEERLAAAEPIPLKDQYPGMPEKFLTGTLTPEQWDRLGRPGGLAPLGQGRENLTFPEKVGTALGNIPSSGARVLGGLYTAVTNPPEAISAVGQWGVGGLATGYNALARQLGEAEDPRMQRLETPFSSTMEGVNALIANPVNAITRRIIERPAEFGMDVMGIKGMGNMAARGSIGKNVPPAKRTALNVGERWGIPTTYAEDVGSAFGKRVDSWLDTIPFLGTEQFRYQQVAAAQSAASEFLGNYIKNSRKATWRGNKEYVDALYKKVRDEADILGVSTTATETLNAAEKVVENISPLAEKFTNAKVRNFVTQVLDDVSKKKKGRKTIQNQYSFDDLWQLRQGLSDVRSDLYAQGQYNAARQIKEVLDGVNKDMDFISNAKTTTGGERIGSILKDANDAYKTYQVKHEAIQEAYDHALGKPIRDEFGKEIIALESGKTAHFSPQRFATRLKKIVDEQRASGGTLFTEAEIEEMAGLTQIMETVKRAGEFLENPPTGLRGAQMGGAAGAVALPVSAAFANPSAGLAIAAGEGAVASLTALQRFLTTTDLGKRMSRAAFRHEVGSPEFRNIMNTVNKAALTQAAYQSSKAMTGKPTESTQTLWSTIPSLVSEASAAEGYTGQARGSIGGRAAQINAAAGEDRTVGGGGLVGASGTQAGETPRATVPTTQAEWDAWNRETERLRAELEAKAAKFRSKPTSTAVPGRIPVRKVLTYDRSTNPPTPEYKWQNTKTGEFYDFDPND